MAHDERECRAGDEADERDADGTADERWHEPDNQLKAGFSISDALSGSNEGQGRTQRQ